MPSMAQSISPLAKNVIMLISDGAGQSTWDAASYYRHGELGKEIYDGYAVQHYMSTTPLTTSATPTNTAQPGMVYDPTKAWSAAPSPGGFAAYDYLKTGPTDSAAAATALASGQKTYNNAINYDNFGRPLKNISDYATEGGRSVGVVSDVQWTHATPAGFAAHNISRNDYGGIAREIVESGQASVVMGAGHPFYDANGNFRLPASEAAYNFVGGSKTFMELISGNTDYTFIDSEAQFNALADGSYKLDAGEKILGTFRNSNTLQYNRDGSAPGNPLEGVPTLSTMATGALNVLSQDEDGFFLMVEGGAVDWAAHANNLGRIVEEQISFNEMVEAVHAWVERNSSWEETLVIVTTDHANGLMLGPDSSTQAFQTIANNGKGVLPDVKWHSGNHTNELVPIFAHGKGAELITAAATKTDPGLAVWGAQEGQQKYLENNHVFDAMFGALGEDDNVLVGTAGADVMRGYGGNDMHDGLAGLDWAVQAGKLADWTVAGTAQGLYTAMRTGEVDSFLNVERLVFEDKVLALDFDGAAGQVERLYHATFGRASDIVGATHHVGKLDSETRTLEEAGEIFLNSAEASALLALDNTAFVSRLYEQALEREGEAAGLQGWVRALEAGVAREDVLLGFSESAEHLSLMPRSGIELNREIFVG